MINKITVELDLPDSIRFQYLGSIFTWCVNGLSS